MFKRGSLCPMSTAKIKIGTTEFGIKAPKRGDRLMFIYLGIQKEGEEMDPEKILNEMGWVQPGVKS